jgi:hypothetical protein
MRTSPTPRYYARKQWQQPKTWIAFSLSAGPDGMKLPIHSALRKILLITMLSHTTGHLGA